MRIHGVGESEVRFLAVKALLVALLMVLAVSPLTAPFSVHTPVDIHGDITWATPKKAADDLKAVGLPPIAVSVPVADGALPTSSGAPSPARVQPTHSFPLRI